MHMVEHATQVYLHCLPPILWIGPLDRTNYGTGNACIIYQNIDTAKFTNCCVNDPLRIRQRRYVCLNRKNFFRK